MTLIIVWSGRKKGGGRNEFLNEVGRVGEKKNNKNKCPKLTDWEIKGKRNFIYIYKMWEVNTHKHTQHRSPILFCLFQIKKLKKRRRPWKFLLSQKRSLRQVFVLLCHCTRKVFIYCCCCCFCGKADRSERREIEMERE